MKMQAATT